MNEKLKKVSVAVKDFFYQYLGRQVPQQLLLRLSLKDQILFMKQLAVLIRAGVPLFSSLAMLKKHSHSKTMHTIINQVINDVEQGQYLATALGKFRKIFGELTINIIRVAEISGALPDNLDHVVLGLKKKQALRRKVIGASVYPMVIILATLGMAIMLTVFIFPKMIPVFNSIHYKLPWTTRVLLFINAVVHHYALLIIAAIAALIICMALLLKIPKVRVWRDRTFMKTPLVGRMIQTYHTAHISRTLALLLFSGVPVVRSFHIASDTTVHRIYKQSLYQIADAIAKGEKISNQMKLQKLLFPNMASDMVAVGEQTGKLGETFSYLADIYEEEIDEITKNLSTTVEPFLLIGMGILVGFIAISIITPIYGITQHLTTK